MYKLVSKYSLRGKIADIHVDVIFSRALKNYSSVLVQICPNFSEKKRLYYPPNLVAGTIFNHSSYYRDVILKSDYFVLKDWCPGRLTTVEP